MRKHNYVQYYYTEVFVHQYHTNFGESRSSGGGATIIEPLKTLLLFVYMFIALEQMSLNVNIHYYNSIRLQRFEGERNTMLLVVTGHRAISNS